MIHPYSRISTYWDGKFTMNFAPPSAADLNATPGLPAPSVGFPLSDGYNSSVVRINPPLSERFYIRHPAIANTAAYVARFLNVEVLTQVRSDGGYGFTVNVGGKGQVAAITVGPTRWVRFEFNATSGTSVRVRAWSVGPNFGETPLMDYATDTMTARNGGYIGMGTILRSVPGWVLYDHLVVASGAEELGPAKNLPPLITALENSTRQPVKPTGVITSGMNAGIKLAGVYETKGVDRRYYDTAPLIAAIDAATTIQELRDAVNPIMAQSRATFFLHDVDFTASSGQIIVSAVAFDNPRLKPFLKYLVHSLSQFPPGVLSLSSTIEINVGRIVTLNGTRVTGVASLNRTFCSVEQTQAHLDTVGASDDKAHPGVLLHEIAHTLEMSAWSGSLTAMNNAFLASNPEGFSYSAAAAGAPFTGEHPLGFVRGYSRTDRQEDFADVFMAATVPAMYPQFREWIRTDPHLRGKFNAVRKFFDDQWWGTHVIEEMHGSLPHVLPI